MSDIDKAFGLAIRQQRRELRISQEELAFRCGLHRTYISQIERGLKSPSLRVIEVLANSLQIKLHKLIELAEALKKTHD